MQQGTTLYISPGWVPGLIVIDMSWETNDLAGVWPKGPWWGALAVFAGFGTGGGEWRWMKSPRQLELWVPYPSYPTAMKLVAVLNNVMLPTTPTDKGSGSVPKWLAPVSADLPFTWDMQRPRTP
jgi:hypothetical protein